MNEMFYALIFIGGYFAAIWGLAFIARPHRARINRLAPEIAADYPEDEQVQFFCGYVQDTALSWRSAPIKMIAYFWFLWIPGDRLDQECAAATKQNRRLHRDPRVRELMDSYDVSIVAANPVFGVLAIAATLAFRLKAIIHHRGKASRRSKATRRLEDFADLKALA